MGWRDDLDREDRFDSEAGAPVSGGDHPTSAIIGRPAEALAPWGASSVTLRPAARDEVSFGGLAVFSLLRP